MAVIAPEAAVGRIDRICLTVPDLDRAVGFYRDALQFHPVSSASTCDPDRVALFGVPGARLRAQTMSLGRQVVELLAFDSPGPIYPLDSTASDLWFQHCAIVVGDMALAVARLGEAGIRAITRDGPQTLPPNTGGVTAFKFRDPFGHPLELLAFPPGIGDPAWNAPGRAGFEGIDHTALAVSEVERTARFYGALFGFEIGARSTNMGPEQSRLDGIDDVTVDVLALTPAETPPHLELLGYQSGTRRGRPRDWAPRHQAITRTLFVVDDLADVIARIAALGASWPFDRGTWDGAEAVALQDPDGHSLIIRAAT